MAVNGIGFSGGYYYNRMTNVNKADAREEKDLAAPESLARSLEEKGQITLDSLKRPFEDRGVVERNMKITENLYKEALPEKNQGAPYSYLANEDGVIEYNGVIFTLDNERKWLCLGNIDLNHMDQVIRVPLSEGGCLMVNRDSIGDLAKAIGMFSPEDINRILRALKMDGKIQQMKHEIEEMEDGIGKSSEEQNADSVESAKEAAEKSEKTNGFIGYEGDDKDKGVFKLKEWQLDALTGDKEWE